jgi:hypothetical protein
MGVGIYYFYHGFGLLKDVILEYKIVNINPVLNRQVIFIDI